MTNTPTLKLVRCPGRWDPDKPTTKLAIARPRDPSLTGPGYTANEAENRFDRRVFRALMVGGLGSEKLVPTRGELMLTLVYGAIRIVCLGEGVDPKSFDLRLSGEPVHGGWALTCEALATGKICPTITAALERLLFPTREAAQNDADDASSGNRVLSEIWNGPWGSWWNASYYTAAYHLSRLSPELCRQGSGLESFTPEEQESLGALIEGVATMHPIVDTVFRR